MYSYFSGYFLPLSYKSIYEAFCDKLVFALTGCLLQKQGVLAEKNLE